MTDLIDVVDAGEKEENENPLLMKEKLQKENTTKKRDFLDEHKPSIEDLSSHDLFFDKNNLRALLENDFS